MNPKIRNQAFQLLEKNKFTDAIPLLLKVVKKDNNDLDACFALASAYAQSNRPYDAEKYLKQVLLKSPNNAQACYALAYTQESIGQFDSAIKNFKQLLNLSPEQYDTYNHLGNIYLQQGNYAQAEINFKKYLEHDANNLDVLNNLGIIHMELAQYQQAEEIFSGILKQHPQHIHAINNLGNLNKSKGDFDAAEKCFQDVLNIDATHVEAKYNWATIQTKNAHYDKAIALLTAALQTKPIYNKASILLAKSYHAINDYHHALETILHTIANTPGSTEAYQCFASIISNIAISEDNDEINQALLNTFDIQRVDHNLLVKPVIGIINNSDIASNINDIQSASTNDVVELITNNKLTNIFKHKLMMSLLQKTVISDVTMEHVLTTLRQALLVYISKINKAPGLAGNLDFICSLSMQCYNTEYAYCITDEEEMLIKELLSSLEHINKNNLFQLAILSSYSPLHTILSSDQIGELIKLKKSAGLNYLIEQQINAPALETEIKSKITSLSHDVDETSKEIMVINEDAPYPRWISANILNNQSQPSTLFSQPGLGIPEIDNASKFEILIAGCGTGKHSIEIASNFRNTHVTAVDISYNSLAYAIRKNQEYSIENLDYYHADLLNFDAIDKQYNMIEVSGVLHHFAEPAIMLDKLLGVLKPNGIIKIGVYSQRVREPINSIQAEIVNKFPTTVEGIREARQYVINNYDLEKTGLKNNKDFYALSGCRYLLFGANDHNFTIEKIKTLVNQFNLNFLGFDLDDKSVQASYRKQFPDDPTMRNLDNWDKFEALNPKTFTNMYQFKCQKQ